MEDVVKDAIRLGLTEIAITDHVDYGIKYDWGEVDLMPYRQNESLANVNYPAWNSVCRQERSGDLRRCFVDMISISSSCPAIRWTIRKNITTGMMNRFLRS